MLEGDREWLEAASRNARFYVRIVGVLVFLMALAPFPLGLVLALFSGVLLTVIACFQDADDWWNDFRYADAMRRYVVPRTALAAFSGGVLGCCLSLALVRAF